MIIAAQIIGIFAMAANVFSYQFRFKRNILLCQLLGSTLFAVNMFMLGAVMGGLLNLLSIVRALVYIKPERLKIPPKVINAVFMLLYAVSYVLVFAVFDKEPTAFNFVVELLPLVGMGAMTIGFSLKEAKYIRICGFVNSPCWLIYNTLNLTVGGILCELFGLISITSAFIRLDRKRKSV